LAHSPRKTSKPPPQSSAEASASFEQKLAELEDVVRQLEEGEKPLEESLTLYERGVAALKTCHAMLDRTEQRIRLLVKDKAGVPALQDAESIPDDESAGSNTASPQPRNIRGAAEGQEGKTNKGDSLFGQA